MAEEKEKSSHSSWSEIIQSVRTPYGFSALFVLFSESILGILAMRADPPESSWLIIAMISLIATVVVLVFMLAVFRPEALKGSRPSSISATYEQSKIEQAKKVQEIAQDASVKPELIDPKLIRFIPPLSPTQFKVIRLPDENPPKYFNYIFVPTGKLILYQIPFFLLPVTDSRGSMIGHAVIDVQPDILNEPDGRRLDISVEDVELIHLLISAGNGWDMKGGIQFIYKRIGYLRFGFKDGTEQRTDLLLGKHLREWSFGNNTNLVTEIDLSWSRPAWLSHDSTKRFDLLTIPITNSPKHITSIEIVAEFEEGHPNHLLKTPSIIISAITAERRVS